MAGAIKDFVAYANAGTAIANEILFSIEPLPAIAAIRYW